MGRPGRAEQVRRKVLVAALANPMGSREEWAEAAGIKKRRSEILWADPDFKQWVQDRMVLSLGDKVYQFLDLVLTRASESDSPVQQQKLALEVIEKFKLTGLTEAAQSRAGTQIVLNFTNPGGGLAQLPPEPRAIGEAKMIELSDDDPLDDDDPE